MKRLNRKKRTYSNYFPVATSDDFEFRLKVNFVRDLKENKKIKQRGKELTSPDSMTPEMER